MRDTGRANNWTDVGCSAHKLHLAVTGAMGVDKVSNSMIPKCVAAASRLVGHFSHSPLATTEREKRQQQMGVLGVNGQPLRLVQFVKTRWNSVHDMFQRLVKLPVVAVLSVRAVVKQSDAKTLDMSDLLPVLQPLQIVTELLCVEKSTSASVVYPLMYKLVNVDGDSARHKQGTRRQICPEQSRDCSTSVYKRDSSGPGNKRLRSVLDGDSSSRLRARLWPCRRGATSRRADASQRAGGG